MRRAVAIVAALGLVVAAVSASQRADGPSPAAPAAPATPDSPVRVGERYSFGSNEENFAFMRGYGRFEVLEVRGQWAFVQVLEAKADNPGRKQWVNLSQAKVLVPLGPAKKGQ